MKIILLLAKLTTAILIVSINAMSVTDVHAEKVLGLARDTASLAGAARYCELDPELIEEYIAKAKAKIAVMASDDYEKVMGRMEFSNMLAAATGVAPTDDCKTIEKKFKDSLRSRS